jgi:hypothetical protein
MLRRLSVVPLVSIALFPFAGFANADIPGLTDFSGGVPIAGGSFVVGWIFNVNAPITVTALGVYDPSGVLNSSSDVGIFNVVSQSLVVSTTVQSTGSTLLDDFRYQSVSPVSLEQGGTYVIAMTNAVDGASGMNSIVTTASQISYVNSAFDFGDSLIFPDPDNDGAQAPGIFGPNFTFETSASTPEPAYSALGVGFTALLGFGISRHLRRA